MADKPYFEIALGEFELSLLATLPNVTSSICFSRSEFLAILDAVEMDSVSFGVSAFSWEG